MAEIAIDTIRLRELRKLDSWRFTTALAMDYGLIALALMAGHWTLSAPMWTWGSWPLLWLVIANRQHALLVLMHDATHGLAYKTRWLNEFAGEVLCGGPAFVSMTSYRRNHLAHHKWMNTERDPDLARKLADSEERAFWAFPVRDLSARYWLQLWRREVGYQFNFLRGSETEAAPAPRKDPLSKRVSQIRLLSYVVIALLLTAFGLWLDFLLFWAAPAIFVLMFITRMRAIVEHFGLAHDEFFGEVRNVLYRWGAEEALFSPHRVAYHLDHHLFASVPFYRLPDLHRLLLDNSEYVAKAHINDGVIWGRRSVCRDMRQNKPSRRLWAEDARA